jgi:hypothetical protein
MKSNKPLFTLAKLVGLTMGMAILYWVVLTLFTKGV